MNFTSQSSKVTADHHERIHHMIRHILNKFMGPTKASTIHIPYKFRTDMKAKAGLAYITERKMEFNEQLFLENTEAFFSGTIPHEICHIVQFILMPNVKQAHGPEWKNLMKALGYQPNTYHSYDVSTVVTNRWRYVCNCTDKTHMVSTRMHNMIELGERRTCRLCGSRIVYFPIGD